MSAIFCLVLSFVGRGLAMGRSSVQGVPQKCLKGFRVSELILNRDMLDGLMQFNEIGQEVVTHGKCFSPTSTSIVIVYGGTICVNIP